MVAARPWVIVRASARCTSWLARKSSKIVIPVTLSCRGRRGRQARAIGCRRTAGDDRRGANGAVLDQRAQPCSVVAPLVERRCIREPASDLLVHGLLHRPPVADAG